MSAPFYGASQDRLLAILPQGTLASVLVEHADRPIAALLTSHHPGQELLELEAAIVSLLDAGCDYFVCFGATSEGLHDYIDHVALAAASASDRTVMTTWHDDEPAADVADFFF